MEKAKGSNETLSDPGTGRAGTLMQSLGVNHAIGRDTPGSTIRFGRTTWELDLRKKKTFASDAARLKGTRDVVTRSFAN